MVRIHLRPLNVTDVATKFMSAIGIEKVAAAIAQLVEHDLAKVGVASSSLVCRSICGLGALVQSG